MSHWRVVEVLLGVLVMAACPASQQWPGESPAADARSTAPAILEGRVVREADGTPVAGATVRCHRPRQVYGCLTGWLVAQPSSFELAVTDADGHYRFVFPGGLGIHALIVLPTADTGMCVTQLRDDTAGCEVSLLPGQYARADVRVPDSCRLAGRVLDETGQPVVGAEVLVWHALKPLGPDGKGVAPDLRVATDARGEFLVPATSAFAELEVEAEGFVAADRLSVAQEPGGMRDGLVLTLHAALFIEGSVADPAGTPLAGVAVSAWRGSPHEDGVTTDIPGVRRLTSLQAHCRSDARGRFRLGPLPHEEVNMRASVLPGFAWDRTLVPGEGPVQIVLEAGARLSGTVRGAGGQPIAGAVVSMTGAAGRASVSGEDGTYGFLGVQPSESAMVIVLAEGHALQIVEGVAIAPDSEVRLNLALEPEAQLQGRVMDHEGRPVAGRRVAIHGDRELASVPERNRSWLDEGFELLAWEMLAGRSEAFTDEAGRFHFSQLYAGRFVLRVSETAQSFVVTSGGAALELRLPARAEDGEGK